MMMYPTTVEEHIPVDAPLEPAPTPPPSTELAPAELPAGDAAPPPALPAVDAGDRCAAIGGFTIVGTGSCYLVGDTTFAWQEARNFCQAWGGDLVQIGSNEEHAQLVQRIDGTAWIGATDQGAEGTFRWVGGDPFEFTAWSMGQPNNLQGSEDCAELRTADDGWNDVPCMDSVARRSLCEQPTSS
jgi:C-type mannose receptor